MIDYKNGAFDIESDERFKYRQNPRNGRWTRQEKFGDGQENNYYQNLKGSYRNYQNRGFIPQFKKIKQKVGLIINKLPEQMRAPKLQNTLIKIKSINFGMSEKNNDEAGDLLFEINGEPVINLTKIDNQKKAGKYINPQNKIREAVFEEEEDEKEDEKIIEKDEQYDHIRILDDSIERQVVEPKEVDKEGEKEKEKKEDKEDEKIIEKVDVKEKEQEKKR